MVGWFGDQGKKGVCIGKKVGRGQGGIDIFLKVVIFPSQKYAYLKHSEICLNRWACFQKKRHNFCQRRKGWANFWEITVQGKGLGISL